MVYIWSLNLPKDRTKKKWDLILEDMIIDQVHFFGHQFLFFNLVLFYILVKVIFSVLNIIVFNVINNYKNIEFFIESQKEIWINL